MVTTKMELLELLRKAEGADADWLREGVRVLAQALMDAEVSIQVGAGHGERAPAQRSTQRNGYRARDWDTRVGTVELAIPRLRSGSYFPSILEPRRRAERALAAVVSRGSPSHRSRGSAQSWTSRSPRGAAARWTPRHTRLCGSTRWR